jgi:hypothetical protein
MEPGERCICQYDDWYNAFGDRSEAMSKGMRLTVKGSTRVGGCRFYTFAETPDDACYLAEGFKPLRSLN